MKANAQPAANQAANQAATSKPIRLNSRKGSGADPIDFEAKRQAAQVLIDQAEAALQQIADDEAAEERAEIARLQELRSGYLAEAQGFRDSARIEHDENEKAFLIREALKAEGLANDIAHQLGIPIDQPAQVKAPVRPWLKRPIVSILQVAAVALVIKVFHYLFNHYAEVIHLANEAQPDPNKWLQAYDITSIQKLFYEKLVVFTDLPVALLMVFLIVPAVGIYVLPGTKSKVDFYTEFTEIITPWQRIQSTISLILGILFFLAFCHTLKP